MAVHPIGWIIAFAVLAVGAAIQGTIGFGINLLAAPILVLIDPALVPAPIIITSLALNLLVGRRDRGERPWHTMRWPITGQVPACIAGAATVALISPQGLAVLFGLLVLVAVGLSVIGRHPRPTPAVSFGAGA